MIAWRVHCRAHIRRKIPQEGGRSRTKVSIYTPFADMLRAVFSQHVSSVFKYVIATIITCRAQALHCNLGGALIPCAWTPKLVLSINEKTYIWQHIVACEQWTGLGTSDDQKRIACNPLNPATVHKTVSNDPDACLMVSLDKTLAVLCLPGPEAFSGVTHYQEPWTSQVDKHTFKMQNILPFWHTKVNA